MPIETPHQCDNCGNELLLDAGTAGRWDSALHTGGPQQAPRPMGIQWAFYRCPACGFEGPWSKHWIGSSRELIAQYQDLLRSCKERYAQRRAGEEKLEKVLGILDAQKALASLPGSPASFETAVAEAVRPLLKRLEAAEEELRRRRGGRPAGPSGKHDKK
jgi:hypothetical protein